jgi:hypothetical protein
VPGFRSLRVPMLRGYGEYEVVAIGWAKHVRKIDSPVTYYL